MALYAIINTKNKIVENTVSTSKEKCWKLFLKNYKNPRETKKIKLKQGFRCEPIAVLSKDNLPKANYGHTTTLKAEDERVPLFLKQILERGWDDTEIWSLDITISKFILPRLKRFKEITVGCPYSDSIESLEEWKSILQQMIDAFEIIASEKALFCNQKEQKIINKGLKLFREWYFALWF